MHKMNKIHKWFLRLLFKNYKDDSQDLLRPSCDMSIYRRRINSLLTKVYKYIHGLSPEITKKVFYTRANIYNTQQFNVFKTHTPTSNRYGLNSIPYKANRLWNLLPENLKSSPLLTVFKNEIKLRECFTTDVPNLVYCVSCNYFFSCILANTWYWFESCFGNLSITEPMLIHVSIFGEGAVLVKLY